MMRLSYWKLLIVVVVAGWCRGASLEDLWSERTASVVAVEFVSEGELERHSTQTFGTVIDDRGTIIFPVAVIDAKTAVSQLTDFRVYRPGSAARDYLAADYLGYDEFTGWAFVRVRDALAANTLTPITRFGTAPMPRIAQELWGVGLRKKEDGFAAYFLSGRVSVVQPLPQNTALLTRTVTGTGLPAFDAAGRFVGLGVNGFGQAYLQFSARDRSGLPVVMIDPDECAALLLADEVVPYLHRVPENVYGRPLVWLGATGLQPLDPEVAAYLGVGGGAGLVVGEVLEGSPAAAGGLLPRDVVVAIDDRSLPGLKPPRMLVEYFQREVNRRRPHESMGLGVLRGSESRKITVTLEDAPLLPRELPRHYFERLGLTLRDFAYVDGAARHVAAADHGGVIVNFIKPGSPAASAGLLTDDWIRRIGDAAVRNLDEAKQKLEFIETGTGVQHCVIVVDRAGQATRLTLKTN